MLDIVLTAPIRVSAKDTGRVVSMVDTRLDAGDYLVSCEGKLSSVPANVFELIGKLRSGSVTNHGSTASSRAM